MNFLAKMSLVGTRFLFQTPSSPFSTLCRSFEQVSSTFLQPVIKVETSPLVAGLKHVARPRRRCKHCYAVIQV
jgi:hypothetical protein